MSVHTLLEGSLKIKSFTKGEMIYAQGGLARYIYEVKNGEVQVITCNEDGKEFIQGLFRAGDCFGLPSLICDQPYTDTAIAHTNCEVCIVPRAEFLRLMQENSSFHFQITQILSRQLLYKTMMLEEIANEEGEHRLLTLIHYLMKQKDGDNKTLDITKQQLADMSGLRTETVIRIMKKMEAKGLIEAKRGNIVCLNMTYLIN